MVPAKTRTTRPSTTRTVPASALQKAVKGTPERGPGSVGTTDFIRALIANAVDFSTLPAATVEPLPTDSDFIPASFLVGCNICIYDINFVTRVYNEEKGPVKVAELTFVMPQRARLGKDDLGARKTRISSKQGLSQCMSLLATCAFPEMPVLVSIAQDAPAFPGATPGNILAAPLGEDEEQEYYHAPWGEAPVAF